MGEFEELKKVGTKLSRAAESELQKKKQQLEYDERQRRKQEEAQRRRKEAETQKLLRQELERKKMEEEQRKRDAAAQLKAKERARERERELEREKELQEKAKKRANANAPTYSRSRATYSGSSSTSYESSKARKVPATKKLDYSFEYLQKVAQSNGSDRSGSKASNSLMDRGHGERNMDRVASRQAAAEKLKVNRGISPERLLTAAQSFTGTKILKKPPVKRTATPKSPFPMFKNPGGGVNHVRDAGLKAIRDGPMPLNTKKRDLRSIEEVSAGLREKDARREERIRKIKAIEEERERQRQHRENAIQSAKYSRAYIGGDTNEAERVFKEVTGGSASSRRGRSPSRSRSPSPRRRSRSPVRRKRSLSPGTSKKRSYSPEARRRSISPRRRRSISPKRRRSASPPVKRKMSRDMGDRDRDRDTERIRERDRDMDRERGSDSTKASKSKINNGSAKRRYSRSPSPRPSRKRTRSPRGNSRGRGPFDEDMSVSSVIGALFGTRYRAKAEDEDLSDDMEARPDEVFREEARSARIARKEDELEAELERAQMERARKRKLERERERNRS
ncbi:hypothetical protein BGZ54_005424 [Gamsiella multidivaricata]|nr:hypothetical protein BGZ54_005424 [Gamsiella multidivaricata]